MNEAVADAWVASLLAFLALAGMLGLVAGAILVMRPDWLARISEHANRWISTRRLGRPLGRALSLDKWFYQHHRVSGSLMLAGSCWVVVFIITAFDRLHAQQLMIDVVRVPQPLAGGLLDGCVLLALAVSVFVAMVSLFLLLRPSLLRNFEQGANRWISMRRAMYPLEAMHLEFDRFALRYYRQFGLLLLFSGTALLAILLTWLF